jgi:hypothetical protein
LVPGVLALPVGTEEDVLSQETLPQHKGFLLSATAIKIATTPSE